MSKCSRCKAGQDSGGRCNVCGADLRTEREAREFRLRAAAAEAAYEDGANVRGIDR